MPETNHWVSWTIPSGDPQVEPEYLGVCIVLAESPDHAVIRCQELNIAPGADVFAPGPQAPIGDCKRGAGGEHDWDWNPNVEKLVCSECGRETAGTRQVRGEAATVELPPTRPIPGGGEVPWDAYRDRLLTLSELYQLQLIAQPA